MTESAADRLIGCVRDLGVPFQHEPSIRFSRSGVSRRRFLLSVNPRSIPMNAAERIFVIGRRLGMPETAIHELWRGIEGAGCVHFGFEEWRGRDWFKVYLEQPIPGPSVSPFLLHRAWKWEAATDTVVKSRYYWFPGLTHAEIGERCVRHGVADLAHQILRITPEVDYLEVSEEGTGRASFDLNVYDSELRVGDAAEVLRHHGLPSAVLDEIGGNTLGHVAAGRHRDGEDFITIYYGVTAHS